MDSFFMGQISLMPYTFAPIDWLLCNGQSLNISQNGALYSLLGNKFGGDNVNFNIPNLIGAEPVYGTGFYIAVSDGIYPQHQ